MAETDTKSADKPAPKNKDAGQAEVQAKFDEAAAKGYWGEVPPGPANEEFSLESGPNSPSAHEQTPVRVSKYDKES